MMRMSFVDFCPLVDELYDFMQRKTKTSPGIKELWYQKIQKINSSDLREALEWMKDNLDSLPYNLPKAIKKAVFEINKSKPQPKPEIKSYGDCEDCNGIGFFRCRMRTPKGIWYEPIYYCLKCDNYKNWTNDPGDRISKAELEGMGINFKPGNKVLKASIPSGETGTTREFKNIATSLGEGKRLNGGKKYKNRKIDPEAVA